MAVINTNEIEFKKLPGRNLKWICNETLLGAQYLTSCIGRIPVGQTVNPAHAHPDGEELVYIIKGEGRVWIDGEISSFIAGSAILFPQNSIHMVQNNGEEEVEMICFYAPPADTSTYKYYENVGFSKAD